MPASVSRLAVTRPTGPAPTTITCCFIPVCSSVRSRRRNACRLHRLREALAVVFENGSDLLGRLSAWENAELREALRNLRRLDDVDHRLAKLVDDLGRRPVRHQESIPRGK